MKQTRYQWACWLPRIEYLAPGSCKVSLNIWLCESVPGQFDAGQFDACQFEVGRFDVGQFDVGQFDAGQFDTSQFNAGK